MRTAVSVVCGIVLGLCLVVLGPAITLRQTVLNTEFVTSQLDVVDAPVVIAEQLKQQLPEGTDWLYPLIDTVTADLEPWSREQIATIARAVTGYIRGEQEFHALISLTELKVYVQTHLGELLGQLPPETLPFPPEQLDMFVQMAGSQMMSMVPDVLEIDETFLDHETLSQMQTARDYTATLRTILRVVPVVALVMALVIVAVQGFRARPTLRYLGVPISFAGIVCLVLSLLIPTLVWGAVAGQLPPEVAGMAPGIVNDACRPLSLYGGVLLLAGLGLFGLSFAFRPTQ